MSGGRLAARLPYARRVDFLAVDRAFAAAWPAEESEEAGGWLLRAAGGVTRRANSALALDVPDDLDARLEAVTAWYRERGLAPRVQLGPHAHRAGLVERLAGRGWVVGDGACAVLGRSLRDVVGPEPDEHVEQRDAPTAEWLDTWWAVSPREGGDARRHAEGILRRIAAPARFVLARTPDGAASACALGVVANELLVVESVATLPERRRQGAATALVGALLGWAAGLGATDAVLAVERADPTALAFWERLGFVVTSAWTYATPPA